MDISWLWSPNIPETEARVSSSTAEESSEALRPEAPELVSLSGRAEECLSPTEIGESGVQPEIGD